MTEPIMYYVQPGMIGSGLYTGGNGLYTAGALYTGGNGLYTAGNGLYTAGYGSFPGGRARKIKNPNKVAAGKKAAADNPWVKFVKANMKSGVSFRQLASAYKAKRKAKRKNK